MRSAGTSARVGQVGTPERLKPGCPLRTRQERLDASRWCEGGPWGLIFARYCNTAEASDATASQIPAQTPSDRSNTTVKDAPSDH